MSLGGVEESGVDDRVGDRLDANLRGRVDADGLDAAQPFPAGHDGGPDGHAVIVGVYQVDIGVGCQQRVGDMLGVRLVPVAIAGGHYGATSAGELAGEPLMASGGG